jgi:putative phage-type endonuclease
MNENEEYEIEDVPEIDFSKNDDNFFEKINEKELCDFEESLFETTEEYLDTYMSEYSKPDFNIILIKKITHHYYGEWLDAELCEPSDFDEIFDFIQHFVEKYLESMEDELPPRQSINTHIICVQDKKIIMDKIKGLRSQYQPEQRTKEWHDFRHNLMTASNLHKAVGSEAQRNSLIYEKCKPLSQSQERVNYYAPNARQWGNIYEPISIMLYEYLYNTKVEDFGCIQHTKYSCIGASPDGINTDPESLRFGRMIEVKNIVNREITMTPKEEYWIQMQIQMETCDLDECDFIETRFKECDNKDDFYDLANEPSVTKGVYLCLLERRLNGEDVLLFNNNVPKFIYKPIQPVLTKEEIEAWIDQIKYDYRETHIIYTTHFWYLDEFSCILVKRNKLWFASVVQQILDTWKIIEDERINGYEHRAPKKRTSNETNSGFKSIIKLD